MSQWRIQRQVETQVSLLQMPVNKIHIYYTKAASIYFSHFHNHLHCNLCNRILSYWIVHVIVYAIWFLINISINIIFEKCVPYVLCISLCWYTLIYTFFVIKNFLLLLIPYFVISNNVTWPDNIINICKIAVTWFDEIRSIIQICFGMHFNLLHL